MGKITKYEIWKLLLLALKIGIGGSVAYYVAELLHLEFASSAGIIALLTLQTTRWETLKLSIRRIITFLFTFALCWILFYVVHTSWIDYGIYLFVLVLICECLGWRSTMSVNAVIAVHFLSTQNFTYNFLINELLLVVIGITIAIVLNFFHINGVQEQNIIKSMRHVEHQMKEILQEVAKYLHNEPLGEHVWSDIVKLEDELEQFLNMAHEYHGNTFLSHQKYYINYFEMRKQQCGALQNLHAQLGRIRELPIRANLVAGYIEDMAQHVTEMNDPKKQIHQLKVLIEDIENAQLPDTKEEFKNRALLYHTLMDLEEFLLYKKRFVESIDDEQFRVYWKREVEGK